MKKLLSILLALVMILSLATTAFAADGDQPTTLPGNIEIANPEDGAIYNVYMMFELESYATNDEGVADENTPHSYTVAEAWQGFLYRENNQTVGAGAYFFDLDANGYVTAKETASAADIAAAAKEYAKNLASADVTFPLKDEDGNPVLVDGKKVYSKDVALGYYLVDSTLGALCSLDTTHPSATIKEKNDPPSLDKKVMEDSTGEYGESNTADIGETVFFKATITAQPGAENYVLHDTMSAGLSYTGVTGVTLNGANVVAVENADDDNEDNDVVNYTVSTTGLCADCDFHVAFEKDFCDDLNANDKIVVEYTAVVNAEAVIDGDNTNVAKLTYGDNHTVDVRTVTKTFDVTVFKWTAGSKNSDGTVQKKALEGAGFTLYYDVNCTDVVKIARPESGTTYQACKKENCTTHDHTNNEIVTDATGTFTIKGLDAATYYLKETTVPAGYNEVHPNPITITIDENGVVNKTTEDADGVDQVEIENKTGTELPETGGMGTTLIYTLGAILAVGSLILLVVKKRMAAAE